MRILRGRSRGWRIGDGVRIGRSRIQGREVRLADGVRIGDRVTITGDRIEIGKNVVIESDVRIHANTIAIGAETLIETGVTIAGGQTSRSSLRIGANCVVLHRSFLNTTYPLVLEDDVGVGGFCMIFTHGLWQSAFEGYPVTFGPVTIRRGVWLPWHVFVMPGVEIGEGATIGAGSVVTKNIPPRSLAVGTPAKVIKGPPDWPPPMTDETQARLVREMLSFLAEELRHRGVTAKMVEGEGARLESAWGAIVFERAPGPGDIEVVLHGKPAGSYWVNLLSRDWRLDLSRPLHRELKGHLRMAGVRLVPK